MVGVGGRNEMIDMIFGGGALVFGILCLIGALMEGSVPWAVVGIAEVVIGSYLIQGE